MRGLGGGWVYICVCAQRITIDVKLYQTRILSCSHCGLFVKTKVSSKSFRIVEMFFYGFNEVCIRGASYTQ